MRDFELSKWSIVVEYFMSIEPGITGFAAYLEGLEDHLFGKSQRKPGTVRGF